MVYSTSTSKVSSSHSTSTSGSSESGKSRKNKVLKQISKCEKLTIGISQKKDIIGHTAIVLVFEKKNLQNEESFSDEDTKRLIKVEENLSFTIDYGAENNSKSKAALKSLIPGSVEVNEFDPNSMDIKCDIEIFMLETDNQKSRIKKLLKVLIRINMGDYDLLKNNCRDYVLAAYAVIIAFKDEINNDIINWTKVKSAAEKHKDLLESSNDECIRFLRELKENDERKLKVGSNAVAGVSGGVGGAAIAGGTGALVGVYFTVGLTTAVVATTATVISGGTVLAVAGLAVTIPLLIKLARNRRSKKKD